MKNASTLKSNTTQPPKTPGGISKSLLTPCRRLGLSRNWKKTGPSPFISPLAGSGEVKEQKVETRKRKDRSVDEDFPKTPEAIVEEATENVDVDKTPSRNVDLPRRKKSKTLLSTLNKSEDANTVGEANNDTVEESTKKETCEPENKANIATPVSLKCKKSKNNPLKKKSNEIHIENNDQTTELKENLNEEQQTGNKIFSNSEKSPNELRKECIVVIQKKVFKNLIKSEEIKTHTGKDIANDKKESSTSQTLFDSDSDETPLSHLNKRTLAVNEEDDSIATTDNIKLNTNKSTKQKLKKCKIDKTTAVRTDTKPSQRSYDDDDDDFDEKKTILIRKTYEKVIKPQKAKSTGSITQKDIEDIKARIEAKKKLLLAKSLTPETAELRCLIKKWQKGCQDALMELLSLMRGKFPEQNMDYSEMLKTLKIPASLVGYDAENDCFNTPNDEEIILGQFNDL